MESMKVRDLVLLVKSPIVHTSKKQEIFKLLFEGKYDKLTFSFLDIILRKGREYYLPNIAEEFMVQYRDHKGITPVKLTTATKLGKEQLAAIESKLLESDITAKTIELETNVDEDIIGGFVLNIGDKLYDASVSYKLEQFRKSFS
jgi:F-type H+-transporting ATPase subunit delta